MNTSLSHQKGITLLEVMIALVLSGIALLGLAAAELRSLQFATNSFNYTVSTIQANNAIERTWADLCDLQSGAVIYNAAYSDANFAPQIALYTLAATPAPGSEFKNTLEITVSWDDTRIEDDNSVTLSAAFPPICS